jgi:hypothetical protein
MIVSPNGKPLLLKGINLERKKFVNCRINQDYLKALELK